MVCKLDIVYTCAHCVREAGGFIYRVILAGYVRYMADHIWCGICIQESSYRWWNNKWPTKSTFFAKQWKV